MSAPAFVYTHHARETLTDRGVARELVEHTILAPEATEPDPRYPERVRAYRAWPEHGGRVLRVVYAEEPALTYLSSRSSSTAAGGDDVKVRYDPEADALYLRLSDAAVSESEEVRPGIVLDFDANGRVVAIEILDTKDHLAAGFDLAQLTAA